jgi:hypothetical protein
MLPVTVTIQLSDEQAAVLQAQAAQEGLTVDAWLQRMAEQYALAPPPSSTSLPDQRPIWEIIAERMKTVPAEVFERLPQDGASEHDHYLYGSPKRNQ